MRLTAIVGCLLAAGACALAAENGGSAIPPAPPASQADAAAPPSPPAADSVSTANTIQMFAAGKEGLPAQRFVDIESVGDYVYAIGFGPTMMEGKSYRDPGLICCFKRDLQSGQLSYVGNVAVPTAGQSSPLILRAAGGRLYALYHGVPGDQLAWYDLDSKTGLPAEKGTLGGLDARSPSSGLVQLVADPEQRTLYTVTDYDYTKLGGLKIEADGKPVKVSIGAPGDLLLAEKGSSASILLSPDGKNIYAVNSTGQVICFDRKPTGEVARKKTLPLDPAKKGNWRGTPAAAGVTPDGKWLYLAVCGSPGCLAVLKRDPATGEVTVQEAGSSWQSARADFRLAASSGLNLMFFPDGAGGYIGTSAGALLRSFRRDPVTGRLESISDVPEIDARQYSAASLMLDGKNGFLYGRGQNKGQPGIWMIKTGPTAGNASRADLRTSLVGEKNTRGPAAETDWPRWHGPDGTGNSPLKGIRKDWTGGLKKVWEVSGLSPGTCSWSSLAVQGNRLVVTGRHGGIDEAFCFDADKGGPPLWIAEIGYDAGGDYGWGDGPTPPPCIDGDKVYVSGKHGAFACLNLADGRILWEKNMSFGGHAYAACALSWEDLVLAVGGEGKELAAYKKETGEKVWSLDDKLSTLGDYSPLPLKIDGKDQVLCLAKTRIYAIDPRTGQSLWDHPVKGVNEIATPAIAGNTIFAMGGGAVRVENGKATELWAGFKGSASKFTPGMSDPVIVGSHLYGFFSTDGFIGGAGPGGCLACVDMSDGQVAWTENTGNGTLLAVDGRLLCLTYSGDLMLVDPKPEGFKKIAEFKGAVKRVPWMHQGVPYENGMPAPCWAMPAVARGKVYIHYSNTLTCYDLMEAGK